MEFNHHLFIKDGSQLKGACIESLDADPEEPYLNQIWCNTTENKYKIKTSDGIKIIKFEGTQEFQPVYIGDGVNNTFLINHSLLGEIYIVIKDVLNNDFVIDMIGEHFVESDGTLLVSFVSIPEINQYKLFIKTL